jgi:membrane protease YdiL (CAAX protease family)
MKSVVIKLIVFEIFAMVLSWVILPALRGLLIPSLSPNFDQYFSAYGPVLAALCLVLFAEKEKFASFYKHSFINFSKFWKWGLIAFLLPIDAFLMAIIWSSQIAHQHVNFSAINTFDDFGTVGFMTGVLILILTTGIGEEAGWRGYLLPLLSNRVNPFIATWIISVLWGLWHIPLFNGTAGFNQVGGLDMWIGGLIINAFFLTWLYMKSRNPFVPAIFHGTLDAIFNIHVSPVNLAPLVTIISFVGVVILFIFNYHNFFERRPIVAEN